MILPDHAIRSAIQSGRIYMADWLPENVQPASLDVRLGDQFLVLRIFGLTHIDMRKPADDHFDHVVASDTEPFVIHPGQFVLGATMETIGLPNDLIGRIEGKSSVGRWGIRCHSTAGYLDAGFRGAVTLELSNDSTLPVLLYPGMNIAQISFHALESPCETPYGTPGLNSKYQGQSGPTASRYSANYRTDNDAGVVTAEPERVR